MRERDDEDLAVDQLTPAGREDDPNLCLERRVGSGIVQERGAERLESAHVAPRPLAASRPA
jgi:hypothetical protein